MSALKKVAEWARGLSGHSSSGEELPDPKPLEAPIDWEAPVPLAEEIRRLVNNAALQRHLSEQGVDTFEEADDFDIPDDPVDPGTPWESDHIGKVWTREQEIKSGVVSEPDYEKAKELVAKAQAFIREYEAKQKAGEASQTPPKA